MIDMEMLGPDPARSWQAAKPDESAPQSFSDKDEKLLAAFAKSRPRQPIEDVVEDRNENGSNSDGTRLT